MLNKVYKLNRFSYSPPACKVKFFFRKEHVLPVRMLGGTPRKGLCPTMQELPGSRDLITVVIPTLNESGTLADVVALVRPHTNDILVVDGHSPDGTQRSPDPWDSGSSSTMAAGKGRPSVRSSPISIGRLRCSSTPTVPTIRRIFLPLSSRSLRAGRTTFPALASLGEQASYTAVLTNVSGSWAVP